ncbi:unnamed protein product [Rhizophagus irregularis]|nr:unnamed protein product [Rhizophagus irregularis]
MISAWAIKETPFLDLDLGLGYKDKLERGASSWTCFSVLDYERECQPEPRFWLRLYIKIRDAWILAWGCFPRPGFWLVFEL